MQRRGLFGFQHCSRLFQTVIQRGLNSSLFLSFFLVSSSFEIQVGIDYIWLVVWNIVFFHVSGILIPIDFYFLQGLKPPTRYKWQTSQELCSHKFTCDDLFEGENTIMTRRFAFFMRRQTTSVDVDGERFLSCSVASMGLKLLQAHSMYLIICCKVKY